MALKFIKGSEIEHNMKNGITIVNFYANWCGPCQMIANSFEELVERHDTTVLKINIDDDREIAKKYGVTGIPATFFYKDKVKIDMVTGYLPVQGLEKKINEIIKK